MWPLNGRGSLSFIFSACDPELVVVVRFLLTFWSYVKRLGGDVWCSWELCNSCRPNRSFWTNFFVLHLSFCILSANEYAKSRLKLKDSKLYHFSFNGNPLEMFLLSAKEPIKLNVIKWNWSDACERSPLFLTSRHSIQTIEIDVCPKRNVCVYDDCVTVKWI